MKPFSRKRPHEGRFLFVCNPRISSGETVLKLQKSAGAISSKSSYFTKPVLIDNYGDFIKFAPVV